MTPRVIRLALVLACLACAGAAHAEPTNRRLFYTGLALAPPDYLLGVTIHEGSHALMAELVGADVTTLHVFPPGRDPRGIFRFGWTYVRGLRSKTDKALFYIAPKITDALLLGGFAALVFTDAWPHNRYGQLALTVFGTGLWVDFSKDVLAFRKSNDVVRVFDVWCMHGWKQVPARLIYSGLAIGFGYVVVKGLEKTFDDGDPAAARVLPVFARTF